MSTMQRVLSDGIVEITLAGESSGNLCVRLHAFAETFSNACKSAAIRGCILSGDFALPAPGAPDSLQAVETCLELLKRAPALVAVAVERACTETGALLLLACPLRVISRAVIMPSSLPEPLEKFWEGELLAGAGAFFDATRRGRVPGALKETMEIVAPGAARSRAYSMLLSLIGEKPAPLIRAAMEAIGLGYGMARADALFAEADCFAGVVKERFS